MARRGPVFLYDGYSARAGDRPRVPGPLPRGAVSAVGKGAAMAYSHEALARHNLAEVVRHLRAMGISDAVIRAELAALAERMGEGG